MSSNRFDRFDMSLLHASLDAERRRRQLSWTDLVAEINRPFDGTSSIPIAVAAIRDMAKKTSVTSAVVLQVLRWLGQPPEHFLQGDAAPSPAAEPLPEPGPSRILRFDTRAIHGALNAERATRGLTWKQVAAELPGFSESMLSNLATGPLIGFPRVMMLTQWLGVPATRFVRDFGR